MAITRLSTADIIELVMNVQEEDEEAAEQVTPKPTITNLRAKLHTEELKDYLTSNGKFDEEEIDFLNKLYNKLSLISSDNLIQKKLEF